MRAGLLAVALLIEGAIPVRAQGPPSDEAAVRAHFASFSEAWIKGDAKAVAEGFAEDGDLVRPGEPRVVGRAAIETFYARMFAGPLAGVAKTMKVEHVRFVGPEVAVVDSSYTLDREQPVMKARGASVTVLAKRAGVWTTVASRSYRLPGAGGPAR